MRIVISAHLDSVFLDPFAAIINDILGGACDNLAGILACAQIIGEEDVNIQFTHDEERHMDGCRYVAKDYSPEDTFMIVVDVTERKKNWKKVNFTVENWHGITDKHVKKALKEFNGHYKLNKNGGESEAWLYRELGFACLEIDIPVSGGLHSLNGKARIEDILIASKAIKVVKDYVKDKERNAISDIYKVGE